MSITAYLDATSFTRQRSWLPHVLYPAAIIATLMVSVALTRYGAGPHGAYAYIGLLSALLGAAWFGVLGGVVTALLAGLSLGLVPLSPAAELQQSTGGWVPRLLVFVFIGGVAGVLHTRLRRQAEEAVAAARVDPMTGLPNASALRADLAFSGPASAEEHTLAVILLRATDLAEIIDVIGFDGGDLALRELARRLRLISPEIQGVYRFGDSGLAFIAEARDYPALKRVARTLHDAAGASFEVEDAPIRLEPAIGIGHISGNAAVDPDELIRRARVALRHAMGMDRDWVAYEPTIEKDDEGVTVELISGVERGLDACEFELHYQPKIRLSDGQLAGVEALIRWCPPTGKMIMPGAFMPKVEKTSLIDDLSAFVIRAAAEHARTSPFVPVSINLAARNFGNDDLISMLIRELRHSGTSAENLEVEITESALMRDPATMVQSLQRLRAAGIGVCIDDFGTGYASFSYLRTLPVTNLKIDLEFVRPLEWDFRARSIVLAMVEVAHALNLTVTAEGVETEAQMKILTDLGCDFGQGFLWSAALPAHELGDRFRAQA